MTKSSIFPAVALGFTLSGRVPDPVFAAWLRILRNGWRGPIYHERGIYIKDARNRIARSFLEDRNRASWLLFWDYDQVPPPDLNNVLTTLTIGRQPCIIGGLYYQRLFPFEPNAYTLAPDGLYSPISASSMLQYLRRRGTYHADAVGTGSTLIHRAVLEDIAAQNNLEIFQTPVNPDTGLVWSEDLWFCKQAKKRGWQIYLDTRLESSHLRDADTDSRDYLAAHGLSI